MGANCVVVVFSPSIEALRKTFPFSCIVPQSEMWIRPGRFEFSSTPSFFLPIALLYRPIFALLSWKAQGYMVYSFFSYANRELRFDQGPNAHPASFWLARHSTIHTTSYIHYINLIAQSAYLLISPTVIPMAFHVVRAVSSVSNERSNELFFLITQISLHDVHWLFGIFIHRCQSILDLTRIFFSPFK